VWSRLWFSVKKEWLRGLERGLAALGIGWTIVEIVDFFWHDPDWLNNGQVLVLLLVVASSSAALSAYRPMKVKFRLHATDTTIEICFGDLFTASGHRVIPVNECFDSELGLVVAESTLHGQFVKRCDGGGAAFDAQVDDALAGRTHDLFDQRPRGKTKRYPVGTTAKVKIGEESYLLVAVTKTDPATHQASTDFEQFWSALIGLWRSARATAGGDVIAVPLIGSGLARVGLPPLSLLQTIILSLIVETKKQKVANLVQFVLPIDKYEAIDLRHVKKEWA